MLNFYILLAFLLITIALLIAVSIYCCMIKYWANQKYLLSFHVTDKKINKCIIRMESDDELKEINIKNRTCYYFEDIIKIEDSDHDTISVDEKSYENILVYNISYENFIASKPLPIRFNKVDVFIRAYDGIRYLVWFGKEKYDSIYNRIRYLICVRSRNTYVVSHNYANIKVHSFDSLWLFIML